MSISNDTISKIKYDFYTGPDNALLDLTDSELNEFWGWFEKNANKYEVSDQPNNERINITNMPGQCFGNAQTIACEDNVDYCEGFMKSEDGFILHGYNISEEKVEDYTVLSNSHQFEDTNKHLPSEYYGIKIPIEFINEHNGQNINDKKMNIRHLIDWYFKRKKSI